MRRIVVALVVLIALSLQFPSHTHAADPSPTPTASATPVAPPAPPTGLVLVLPHAAQSFTVGSWVSSTEVDVRFSVQIAGSPLTPQGEIQPSGTPFTGQPNFNGSPMSASGTATLPVQSLENGRQYHLQVRVADGKGNVSAWVPYSSLDATAVDFGVDTTPPTRPVIHSPTDPDPNHWYNTRSPVLRWSARDRYSGIKGYTFALERRVHVIPPGSTTSQTGARLSNLPDGVWFLAIRAEDRAGNWSPTATFRLQLDRRPPQLTWLSAPRVTLNPYRGGTTLRFRVDQNASVRLDLYRVGSSTAVVSFSYPHLLAGQVATITWNGKLPNGKTAPRGYYFFSATAIDEAKNEIRTNLGGIALSPLKPQTSPSGERLYADGGKRIIVSLGKETLYAYDGTKLVQQTFVTTGNPSLPTPTGHFTILARFHPYEFISPWPQGSPYWYAPSWSQYAMLFRDGGYFLHDAPWRSAFGPGTNGPGQPGTNYGGTHGCVNIPPDPMLFLWNWAPIGTPVDVVP